MQRLRGRILQARFELDMVGHAAKVHAKLVAEAGGPELWGRLGQEAKELIAGQHGVSMALVHRFLSGDELVKTVQLDLLLVRSFGQVGWQHGT
jgi:hypothetical protein